MSANVISVEQTSELIGLVYDSAFQEPQWKLFLDRICDLFPGIMACVYGYEENVVFPQYVVSGAGRYLEGNLEMSALRTAENLGFAEGFEATPVGWINRTKRYFSEEGWRSMDVYLDVFKPLGKCHNLQLKIDSLNGRGAILGFAIPDDPEIEAQIHDPLFELLKLLSPHIVRALRLARALNLAKRSTDMFKGFLDDVILPMFVTNAQGQYVFANAAGQRMLERGEFVNLDGHDRLQLNGFDDSTAIHREIARLETPSAMGGLQVANEETALALAITPFRPSMRHASDVDRHLLEEERLFAIFIGQSTDEAVHTSILEDVFELTSREAEVCKSLMLGENAQSIAANSGRSLKTVRNQTQIIYDKIGVSSNVELIDRLSVFRTIGSIFESGS